MSDFGIDYICYQNTLHVVRTAGSSALSVCNLACFSSLTNAVR